MTEFIVIDADDLDLLVRAAEAGASLYPHRFTVGQATRVGFVVEELRHQR